MAAGGFLKKVIWFAAACIITLAIFKALPHTGDGILNWAKTKSSQTETIVKDKTKGFSLDGIKAPKLLPKTTPAPKTKKHS